MTERLGFTIEEVTALIEEVLAVGYSQSKAHALNVLEGVMHQSGLGSKPEGTLMGTAVNLAQRAMLDVLGRHMPEITQERITEARAARERRIRDRQWEERGAATAEEIAELRRRLRWLESHREDAERQRLLGDVSSQIAGMSADELQQLKRAAIIRTGQRPNE